MKFLFLTACMTLSMVASAQVDLKCTTISAEGMAPVGGQHDAYHSELESIVHGERNTYKFRALYDRQLNTTRLEATINPDSRDKIAVLPQEYDLSKTSNPKIVFMEGSDNVSLSCELVNN